MKNLIEVVVLGSALEAVQTGRVAGCRNPANAWSWTHATSTTGRPT